MYESGEVDRVELVYTRFHYTAGSQEVVLRPLVPLTGDSGGQGGDGKAGATDGSGGDYRVRARPI